MCAEVAYFSGSVMETGASCHRGKLLDYKNVFSQAVVLYDGFKH